MLKFMLLAAIASLAIVNARFAFAQAAIQEPGAYAFYHPDGDLLHVKSSEYQSGGIPNAMALMIDRHGPPRRHGRTQ